VLTMQQQKKNRVIIVSGLVQETIEFHTQKEHGFRVKKKFYKFIASGGQPHDLDRPRKAHRRQVCAFHHLLAWDWQEHNKADYAGRRFKSYAMRREQFMSEATKARQAEKSRKLLARLKHPTIQTM
jgi:hypothetical protein